MEVRFATKRLARLGNSHKEMRGQLGPACAKKLQQRLLELKAATTLEDLRQLPGAKCHELTGDRKGELAANLEHPLRLVFEPDHDPIPRNNGGGLDWKSVTAVVVVEIVDYH